MLLATVITEVVLASLVLIPLLLYRLKTQRWNRLTLDYPTKPHQDKLTILLPIWNESLVIEKKLSNLKRDYPFETSLLVIDSASDDDSITKVKQWLTQNEGTFSTTQLIAMPERLGKTSAVKQALDSLTEQNYQGLNPLGCQEIDNVIQYNPKDSTGNKSCKPHQKITGCIQKGTKYDKYVNKEECEHFAKLWGLDYSLTKKEYEKPGCLISPHPGTHGKSDFPFLVDPKPSVSFNQTLSPHTTYQCSYTGTCVQKK